METYRVLWTDAADEGRFTDIQAVGMHEAIWQVAISTESKEVSFVDIQVLDD